MRAWSAIYAAGGPLAARACGRTAARLIGLPLIDDDDPLLAPADRQHAHDDVAVRRQLRGTATLHPARVTWQESDLVRVQGCPTLHPARLLLDLTRVLTPTALVCAVDDALHRGLVDVVELEAMVQRWAGRPGAARLRTAVELSDRRSQSALETLGRLELKPVLPDLLSQIEIREGRGRLLAVVDFALREQRLAIEGDGKRGHAGLEMVAKDRQRERAASREGWRFERFTWWDVRRGQADLRTRVLAAAGRG